MNAIRAYDYCIIDTGWHNWTTSQRTAVNWLYAVVTGTKDEIAIGCACAWINTEFGEQGPDIQTNMSRLVEYERSIKLTKA